MKREFKLLRYKLPNLITRGNTHGRLL